MADHPPSYEEAMRYKYLPDPEICDSPSRWQRWTQGCRPKCLFSCKHPIKNRPPLKLVAIVMLSLLIALLIFFLCIKPDIDYRSPYVETTCRYGATQISQDRCCDVINCKCSECGSAPTCLSIRSNQSSLIGFQWGETVNCCNGYRCCHAERDTCYRDIYWDCYCYEVRERRYCSTCRDRIGYECGSAHCTQSVNNDLCQQVCGICYQLLTPYFYNVTGQWLEGVLGDSCGRDDWACVQGWTISHRENQNVTCWYNSEAIAQGAELTKPVHRWNITAIVFAILFGSVSGIGIILIFWIVLVQSSKLHNYLLN